MVKYRWYWLCRCLVGHKEGLSVMVKYRWYWLCRCSVTRKAWVSWWSIVGIGCAGAWWSQGRLECRGEVSLVLVVQVLGHKEGLSVMERADPLFLLIGLPMVPVSLILSKMIRWEDFLLRLWRKHCTKLPLISYFFQPGISRVLKYYGRWWHTVKKLVQETWPSDTVSCTRFFLYKFLAPNTAQLDSIQETCMHDCTWLEWWALIGRLPIAAMFSFCCVDVVDNLLYRVNIVFWFIFKLIQVIQVKITCSHGLVDRKYWESYLFCPRTPVFIWCVVSRTCMNLHENLMQ